MSNPVNNRNSMNLLSILANNRQMHLPNLSLAGLTTLQENGYINITAFDLDGHGSRRSSHSPSKQPTTPICHSDRSSTVFEPFPLTPAVVILADMKNNPSTRDNKVATRFLQHYPTMPTLSRQHQHQQHLRSRTPLMSYRTIYRCAGRLLG
jgi:hypothetical protein